MVEEDNLLHKLFVAAEKYDASDLHLTRDAAPYFRVAGRLMNIDSEPLSKQAIEQAVEPTLNDRVKKQYEEKGYVDYAYEPDIEAKARYRIELYKSRGCMTVALRRVKSEIPSFEELNLPTVYERVMRLRPKGIIVIGGETSSGKSTTLAAMMDFINQNEKKHIVTIEDPIEYLITNNMSWIDQREFGADFHSYADALRAVVRQDPDVIMIGEIRDRETVEAAIAAAETGHLVFSTLHTTTATQTFYRILNFFPPDQRYAVRQNLSATLIAIMNQMLLPCKKPGTQIIPATEVLINTPAVKMYIEKSEENKLPEVMEKGGKEGMRNFNKSLKKLLDKKYIDQETALKASLKPEKLDRMLRAIKQI
ncbi:MAG: PilT/PilU family type 4a pilus ATPase [Planctomycetes bacterium]|nr:PilT/PilU family type 4a pilus ATPase [Planctomycetota bacterium]